jgi:hypothetical protein
MYGIFQNFWPDLRSSRILFMIAVVVATLGFAAASCTVMLLASNQEPQWAMAFQAAACTQSLALFVAGGLMLPATVRERRDAPRALVWATLSAAALLGTVFILWIGAADPDSLVFCGVTCAPFFLVPGALAVYYGMKARGDPLPAPPSFMPGSSPPIFPPGRIAPPPADSADEALAWLESLKPGQPAQAVAEAPASDSAAQTKAQDPAPSIEAGSPMEALSQTLADSQQLLDEALQYPSLDPPATPAVEQPAGEPAASSQKPCPSCGAMLDVPKTGGYVFCFQCGAQVES